METKIALSILEIAKEFQDFANKKNWEFCFIGGIAIQRWGQPRVTNDVDITLLTRFANEENYIKELIAVYEPRIDDAVKFALQNRVLLLKSTSGVGLDIAFGGLPFEESAIKRSKLETFLANLDLKICSAEDLIIMKAFANRDRDWIDVESVIIRNNDFLDWKYINNQLIPLLDLKEEPEIIDKLNQTRNKLSN